jgi:hypothetical protein
MIRRRKNRRHRAIQTNFLSLKARIVLPSGRHRKGGERPKHVGLGKASVMFDSERYRDHAADCLKSAAEASDPYYRRIQVDLAASWITLAIEDETINAMIASWAIVAPAEATLAPD